MKVAITGATGFLGKRAAEILKDAGHEVVALGRNKVKADSLISKGIEFRQCSLADEVKLSEAIKGCDYVVHSAALSSAWGEYEDFYQSNVLGTICVANACLKNNVKRLVHISTPSLYVTKEDKLKISESDPLPEESINYYAQTKRIAEEELLKLKNLDFIILRPQGIFGPGDQALFPRLKRLADKGILPIIGEGNNLVDLTYVDNVVSAIIGAIDADKAASREIFNITNGEPVNNSEMLKKLMSELNVPVKEKKLSFSKAYRIAGCLELFHRSFMRKKEPLLTKYSVCALSKTRTLSIEKAQKLINYNPPVKLKDGMVTYVAWCKEQMSHSQTQE